MTAPAGGGNNVNLAALWVPVMPETSQLGPEMRKAGEKAKSEFQQGFTGGGGSTPEQLGADYGSRMTKAIGDSFMKAELPLGLSKLMELSSKEIDEKLSNKLTGSLSQAMKQYTEDYNALAAAQAKAEEASRKYNLAVDNGFNKASITLPLLSEQRRAQTELTAATEAAAVSHTKLGEAQGKVDEFQKANSVSGNILAGVMGGAVAAGIGIVTTGFEKILELGAEVFEGAIEGAKELADHLIEIGESYEGLEHQVELYSSAQGEAFEELNASAAKVFGQLDVSGEKVGQTMAQLSSRLDMEAGPALEQLTRHVTELQGRFGALDTNALAAVMVNFKVPTDDADKTLASLVESSRAAGISIGDMTTALDTASPTLAAAGLNAEQAGAFIAEMTDRGLNARQMMAGLGTAQATFTKHGLDFKDGMKQAADELQHYVDIGDTVDADALSQKLFGSRNWAGALAMIQSYNEVLDAQPGKYDASSSSLDELIDNTQTLSNKWEEIKHKIEEALAPIGLGMVSMIGKGFDQLTDIFERNRTALVMKVKSIGDSFISMLPEIQAFGSESIRIMGAIGEAVLKLVGFMATSFGTMGHQIGDLISLLPDWAGGGKADDIIKASDAMYDVGHKAMDIKFSDDMSQIADWIKNLNVDVPTLTRSWDSMTTNMLATPTIGGGGSGIAGQGQAFNPSASSGFPGLPEGGGDSGRPIRLGNGQVTGGGGAGNAQMPGASIGQQHVADWDAIAKNESSGNWQNADTGGNGHYGGLQISPSTWAQYGGNAVADRPDHASKADQIMIANRILNGWNGIQGQGPNAWDNGRTYVGSKDGSTVQGSGMDWSGMAPNSHDTEPIWVEPGEEIITKDSAIKHRDLLKLINADAFRPGGTAGSGNNGGNAPSIDQWLLSQVPTNGIYTQDSTDRQDLTKGMSDCSAAVEDLVNILQGRPTSGSQMYTGNEAEWLASHGFVPGEGGPGDFRVGFNSHHTQATLPGGTPFNWGGPESAAAGGVGGTGADDAAFTSHYYLPMRGSQGGENPQFPGMPNQYGGLGAYGGQTADQQYQTQQAIKNAQDRASDMDYNIGQKQKDLDTLNKNLSDLKAGDKGGLLGDPEIDKKIAAAQKQIDDATHDLSVMRRERADQDGVIAQAERKAQESALQAPDKVKTQKATGSAAFEELGGGLLKGVMGDLGLGDVFGKSPLDWGIVKLLGGMANWGIGTANAWADEIGKGHTGMTGFSPLAGFDAGGSSGGGGGGGGGGLTSLLTGMAPGLGSLMPQAQQSQYPNTSTGPNIAVDPTGSVHGAGAGQPPGPVIGGDYQPVNVTNNGPKQSDLDAWKAAQNSNRSQGAMSGLPGGGG